MKGGRDSGVGMGVTETEGMSVVSGYITKTETETEIVTKAMINEDKESRMCENEDNSDESMDNQNMKNQNIKTTVNSRAVSNASNST